MDRFVSPLVGVALALTILPPAVHADDVLEVTTDLYDPVADLALDFAPERVELALDDAIVQSLKRNLGLVVQRYVRSQSEFRIQEAYGIYDLNLQVDYQHLVDASPPGSLLEDALVLENEFDFFNVELRQLLPTGGQLRLDFDNQRFESTNQFIQPNPQFEINLDVVYSQPLLRNFGRAVTERSILIARNNAAMSLQTFQQEVERIVQEVSNAYWDLVEAREQLEVSEESLRLAEELHEMNRIQVEVGTLAPLEMVQSEAGVATREEEIIRRQAAVEDAADRLRRLINIDAGSLWSTEIIPVTDPAIRYRDIDVAAAFRTALAERPDVRSRLLDIRNREIDAEYFENQLKPRLDVQVMYGQNALDGQFMDPDTEETLSNDYFDAFEQLAGDFDNWSVGFTFAYPLQNRTAKAQSAIAELAVEEGELRLRDLRQQVLSEVRAAARNVETAAKQIESAKVSSRLARENLEAERRRYENGLSTSFRVLEIQEDLSAARSREVSAVIGYRKAAVAFDRVIGQLLEETGVRLAEDPSLDG